MAKNIELVRQEVAAMRNEVEDFANSAERVGGVVSDVLEYGHEQLTDGKNKHEVLAERVTVAEGAISAEVARAQAAEELINQQAEQNFRNFSELGVEETAKMDGYEIALTKKTNTAGKTKVKVPVYDMQDPSATPVGLVDEIFVEDMKAEAKKMVDAEAERAEAKEQEIEGKVAELGSEVGNSSTSFKVTSSEGHSSSKDVILINGKVGDVVTMLAESSDGNTDAIVAFYGIDDNGTSEYLGERTMGTPRNITLTKGWKYVGVYVPNFANATITFSVKANLTKDVELIKSDMSKNGMFIYFLNYQMPTFELNGTTLNITFPLNGFRLYRESGEKVLTDNLDYNGVSFNLEVFDKLVVNTKTNIVSVKRLSAEAENNDVVLLAYVSEKMVFSGLLEPYVSRWYNEYTESVSNESDMFFYFTDVKKPVIIRTWDVVTIQFPTEANYRIYNRNFTFDYQGAANGEIYEIPQGSALVFDCESSVIKVESFFGGSASNKYIPLFVNGATYNDGGLLSHYMTNQTLSEMQSDVRLYEAVSIQDSMSETSNTISVDYGVISINKGFSLLYKARRYPIVAPEPYYIRTLDDLNGTRVTRTYVYIDTSLLKADTSTYITGDNKVNLFIVSDSIIDNKKYLLFATFYFQVASGGLIDVYRLKGNGNDTSVVGLYSSKEDERNQCRFRSDFNCLFFSDIHKGEINMERILNLSNSWGNNYIDVILNGGDTVRNLIDDGLDWYHSATDTTDIDVLAAAGNHDEWTGSVWNWAESKDIYNELIAPIVSKVTNIIQPDNAESEGKLYYYKDYNKVRVLVLEPSSYDSNTPFWDSEQNDWMIGVLEDARINNLAVICLCHVPFNKADGEIDEAISFNSWTGYTDRYIDDKVDLQSDPLAVVDEALDNIDTFINNGGTFVCWLAGHTHRDYFVKSVSHPKQMMFVTASALYEKGSDYQTTSDESSPLYDCMNYIGIDLAKMWLKILRLGKNIDGLMRKKDVLVYDLNNQKVITNY